jgi:hypothetical protein
MPKVDDSCCSPFDTDCDGGSHSARLAAIAQANLADAQVWRWFSDGMEDGRLRVTRQHDKWVIVVDGQPQGIDESLDAAVRGVQQRVGPLATNTNSWSRFSGSFMWNAEEEGAADAC